MRRLVTAVALLAGSVCFAAPVIAAEGDSAITQTVDQPTAGTPATEAAPEPTDEVAATVTADQAEKERPAPIVTKGTDHDEPSKHCGDDEPAARTGDNCAPAYPYTVKVCWKMQHTDGKPNTYEFPQVKVYGSWCDRTPKCGETVEYQHDTYWIRDTDDAAYLAGLRKLSSPADDARLEPHDYYSVVKHGPSCHPAKEVKACWKLSSSDGLVNTSQFTKTRVWGEDCDAPPTCGETVEYEHVTYWIRSKHDWWLFTHLEMLTSTWDDARLEPHDRYSNVLRGEKCPTEVTPAVILKSNCDSDDVPAPVETLGVTYTYTEGDGTKGPWKITASPLDEGYVFPEGAQTVFTGDAGDPASCDPAEVDPDPADPPAEDALLPDTGGLPSGALLLAAPLMAAGIVLLMRREPASHPAQDHRGSSHLPIAPIEPTASGKRAHASTDHIGLMTAMRGLLARIGSSLRGGRH